MSEPRYGLTAAQWNEINADALRAAAESFTKFPDAMFKGSEVATMLNDAADLNPTAGNHHD